jgi:hypothetical protein
MYVHYHLMMEWVLMHQVLIKLEAYFMTKKKKVAKNDKKMITNHSGPKFNGCD